MLSGCETMNGGAGNISHKDENSITLGYTDAFVVGIDAMIDGSHVNNGIAARHCKTYDKYAFYFYEVPLSERDTLGQFLCSKNYLLSHPETTAKLRWTNFKGNKLATTEDINFTIKDKKEQCTAIGFEPATEKFADCVLRLVELDVKKQQSNKIAHAQNSGNDALVRQLKQQQYDRGTDVLLNLGQQLLKPKQYNSNIYMPQTQRCTIQGFGTFAKIVCR